MFTRRSNPPPPRPATLHVRVVRSNFEVREETAPLNRRLLSDETPAPPRFVRRAPVAGELLAANNSPAVAVSLRSETDEPFIKPPTRAQLMARR